MIKFQSIPTSYRSAGIVSRTFSTCLPIVDSDTVRTMRSEFGQRLFAARKRANLTQTALAAAVGATQSNYGELENKGQMSRLTPAIASVCGVSVQWLAYGRGEMLDGDPVVEVAETKTLIERRQYSPEVDFLAKKMDLIPDIGTLRMELFEGVSALVRAAMKQAAEASIKVSATPPPESTPAPALNKVRHRAKTPS